MAQNERPITIYRPFPFTDLSYRFPCYCLTQKEKIFQNILVLSLQKLPIFFCGLELPFCAPKGTSFIKNTFGM